MKIVHLPAQSIVENCARPNTKIAFSMGKFMDTWAKSWTLNIRKVIIFQDLITYLGRFEPSFQPVQSAELLNSIAQPIEVKVSEFDLGNSFKIVINLVLKLTSKEFDSSIHSNKDSHVKSLCR